MPSLEAEAARIFLEAVEEHERGHWDEFVRGASSGDPELLKRVNVLLKAHDESHPMLQSGQLLATVETTESSERPGTMIGPYKLLEQIGEGGMGLIFVAEQQLPVRRTVALKVIKPGMDSRQVIARFEAERQALALMDHPNIAKVLDAGTTDAGRPYFVMELVRGIPITEYCDQARLAVRQRLEVFIQVCRAVQHAHTKGVIHRDLKPTNVLVTSHDGIPVPLVIDFGVAKALGQQLTEHTLHTAFAQMVGTPLYMSPEQAEFNQLGVDTRSDIYSLGVLLYELLTGVTPFDQDRLRTLGHDEFRRILREEEPPRPSARLSTLEAAALSTVSQRRSAEPRKLTQALHGELDWIVLKSLEKDRTRRYETASAFAADMQRYLNDEAVEACPPRVGYRVRKYVRRNRAAFATTAMLVLMLLGAVGAVTGAVGWGIRNRSALEEDVAQDRETRQRQLQKEAAALLEDVERQRTEIYAKLADPIKVSELLSNIDAWHDTLGRARDGWNHAKNLAASNDDVITEKLEQALQEVDRELQADEADWKLAKELDDVRLESATLIHGVWNPTAANERYKKIFEGLGVDLGDNNPAKHHQTLAKAKLRYVLVAALDYWVLVMVEEPRKSTIMSTASLSDPDPWRDQVRNPGNWTKPDRLNNIVQEGELARQSPQVILLLARVLRQNKIDAVPLLHAGLLHYPHDFWLHLEVAEAIPNWMDRIGHYYGALAVRPDSSPVHNNLAFCLKSADDLEGAIGHFRRALDRDPLGCDPPAAPFMLPA